MSKLGYTEREIAEHIISGLSKALVTARADGRREGLEMAAKMADAHMAAMQKKLAKPGLSEFDEGLWASASTEASYIADAIRAMMEKEG